MAPQAYKVVNTHDHKISVWNVLFRLLHARAPNIGGTNGDVQYYLTTLEFNKQEQLKDFHGRIIRLQKEIILSRETVYPKIILFQYTKALSKSDKIKSFITPNITDIITFRDNNGKLYVYTGEYIHGLYRYLEMVGAPTTLTTSFQRKFCPSYPTNNDTATLQPVIADLLILQKTIWECWGRIVHKADYWIIRGTNFLPTNLRINMIFFDIIQDSLWNKSSTWLDYIEFRIRLNQFEFSKNMKTVYPEWKQCWRKNMYK